MINNKYRLLGGSALIAVVCTGIYIFSQTDADTVLKTIVRDMSVNYMLPVNYYMDNIDSEVNYDLEKMILYDIYPAKKYVADNYNKNIDFDYREENTYKKDMGTEEAVTTALTGSGNSISLGNNTGGNKSTSKDNNSDSVNKIQGDSSGNAAESGSASAETAVSNNSAKEVQNSLKGVITRNEITGSVYSREDLNDYNFTHKNFYTVTSITSLTSDILRPAEFLDKNMSISCDASCPQILIFHTHSQETFVDSVEGDPSTSIVGVGDYLTELLTAKGYNVIHDKSVYDYVDGKLDRSKAYTYAENGIAQILNDNPSIDVVIDLHRDGVADTTHLLTEIDGKQMAKIMFFNGLSYSNVNGNIGYLYNPYRDDNLAMSLQMQLLGEAYYPGFLRNIYINAYRYCLHERGKSMLIEAGAQTNTVQEVKNAMEPLSDMLDKLLKGQKAF